MSSRLILSCLGDWAVRLRYDVVWFDAWRVGRAKADVNDSIRRREFHLQPLPD
jgi:hypothetical protein